MEGCSALFILHTFSFTITFVAVTASEGYFCKCASLENRICTNHLLLTVNGIRHSQCLLKCLSYGEICQSVLYNEITGKCQGYSSALTSHDNCTDEDGSKYYQKCQARMPRMPVNCKDIQCSGQNVTGIYTIYPDENSNGVSVRCDMDKDGGGWTVLQRRVDGSVDFYRNWSDYKYGFGNASTEYWIGLDTIHKLTSQGNVKLRVDLITPGPAPQSSYASYTSFSVGDETSNYRLTVVGYKGVAGDSLYIHSGMMFTTLDRDNDMDSVNCAVSCSGAWWYRGCHESNLNGIYGSKEDWKGIKWYPLTNATNSLTFAEMKIK